LEKDKKISRRGFIATIGYVIATLFAGIWLVMTRRTLSLREPGSLKLPLNTLGEGVSFHGDVICYRRDNELKFYSSRCTHLGCKLNQGNTDRINCPCHGSQFDAVTGEVLRGPASRSLLGLDYEIEAETRIVEVFYK